MKTINIVLFGVGNVGSSLINQILESRSKIFNSSQIDIKLAVIVNSKIAFYNKDDINNSWEADFKSYGYPYKLSQIINHVKKEKLTNLIAVDATASEKFVKNYKELIRNGFNIVAANKTANSLSDKFYKDLRLELKKHDKQFLYETNVGAGLPVIKTVQDLHLAGEEITKIRGIFSGSLSYIFNSFSSNNRTFSEVLDEARNKGLTEPDPRIDLSGKDVGRKLLILAREINIIKELTEVKIENLVPNHLNGKSSISHFNENQQELNLNFEERRSNLKADEVLRHIGELGVASGQLEVKLVTEKRNSPFGSLQEADASFEIYTKNYGNRPIVIQGAGAGARVTSRGVLSDLLKISEKLECI
ncbi:homoserine dehydrogenase [Gillisia mitskevichiae]|uniref:Homoserine dehydrogenase n=1 Tax=Gillisia mitskevichiae TaxID=270921 RepID=A0A495Q006_9FLAO|nr:aspartate kinase [Gillisia mitskevichiae]RKS56118.1 homoserine dehydrogenase [Gillisia mitskevichiae]